MEKSMNCDKTDCMECKFGGQSDYCQFDEKSYNQALDDFINKAKDIQFHTGRAWFDFDAGIDRCIEIAEQLKE